MRPWTLLVIAGALLSSMLIIAPVRAADDERERFTISGTVWIDENRDRIRQPSEPVLSGVWVHTGISPNGLGGRIFSSSYATNEQGQYTIRKYPYREMGGRRYRFVYLEVRYKEPGAEPVYDDWPYPYTHSGCRLLYILEEEEDRTVDIGVSQYGPALPKNRPVADGRFFRETSVHGCDTGFSVTNADGIPFWDTWQRLGLENVGYPISHRYMWRGFVTQAFQKAIMQWQPGRGVFFVNIFDELHDAGLDEELRFRFSTPRQLDPSFDYLYPVDDREWVWEQIVRRRLALLDANPAIKEKYYSAPDPLLQYGLPTSRVKDHGNMLVIRTQRAVFQQWKQDVPWANAGEVTIANSGDIAKALDRLTCWKPDGIGTSTTLCTHLFFSKEVVKNGGPPALIPQPVGFIRLVTR